MKEFVVYDRSETFLDSVGSDAVTFGCLFFAIWFSQTMGGGVWTFVSLCMFLLSCATKMPWEKVTRTTVIKTKADAMAWANNLQDDAK